MKTSFGRKATEQQRSHGHRRRYHGATVLKGGETRSSFRASGGNPKGGAHGSPAHTTQNRSWWERNGKADTPPASYIRGWQ